MSSSLKSAQEGRGSRCHCEDFMSYLLVLAWSQHSGLNRWCWPCYHQREHSRVSISELKESTMIHKGILESLEVLFKIPYSWTAPKIQWVRRGSGESILLASNTDNCHVQPHLLLTESPLQPQKVVSRLLLELLESLPSLEASPFGHLRQYGRLFSHWPKNEEAAFGNKEAE